MFYSNSIYKMFFHFSVFAFCYDFPTETLSVYNIWVKTSRKHNYTEFDISWILHKYHIQKKSVIHMLLNMKNVNENAFTLLMTLLKILQKLLAGNSKSILKKKSAIQAALLWF